MTSANADANQQFSKTFIHDSVEGEIHTDADEPDFDATDFTWDAQTVVRLESEPWVDHFDTDTFYRFDATLTRAPLEQEYVIDGEQYTFKKLPDELKKAQWSLDNRPFPLGHPKEKIVTSIDQVHGFVKNPRYVEHDSEPDEQKAHVYIPTNDDEAKEFVREHQSVSVGFMNSLDWETEEDHVDAYQREMMYDHVAGVTRGRCGEEDGCSLTADAHTSRDTHTSVTVIQSDDVVNSDLGEIPTTDETTDGCSAGPCNCGDHVTVDAPDGIYVTNDQWFAVTPDEHSKDSTDHADDAMYPVKGCSNVEDAWHLRNHGEDLQISSDTLANRIERAADAQNCDINTTTDSTMTDDNPIIDVDDMTVDAIADKHDGVESLVDKADEVDSLEDELEEKETVIDEKDATIDEYESRIDELEERILEDKRDTYEAKVDELTSLTDHFDEDELREDFDEDVSLDEAETLIDSVDEKLSLAESFVDSEEGGESEDSGPTTLGDSTGSSDEQNDPPTRETAEFMPETA